MFSIIYQNNWSPTAVQCQFKITQNRGLWEVSKLEKNNFLTSPFKRPIRYFPSQPYAKFVCLCRSSWVITLVTSLPANRSKISFPPGCLSRNSLTSYTFPRCMIQKSFSELCCCTSSTENKGSSGLPAQLSAIAQYKLIKGRVLLM